MENQLTRRRFMVRKIVAVIVFIGGVLAAVLGGFGSPRSGTSGWRMPAPWPRSAGVLAGIDHAENQPLGQGTERADGLYAKLEIN